MNENQKEILPNFLIIGAFKSGTNSLYNYLEPHPQVFMSPAIEPSFFAFEGKKVDGGRWADGVITNFEEYKKLFINAKGKIAIGEASPTYLVSDDAPARIKHYLPGVKLIVILRHPVDRAYSQWQMEFRQGNEKIEDFARAIQIKKVVTDGSVRQRFVYGSKYYSLLRRYYDLFDRSQICVLLFDHLTTDRSGLIQKMYRFLNVDPSFVPSNFYLKFNEGGGVPRNKATGFFLQKVLPYLSELKSALPQGIRERVVDRSRTLRKQMLAKPPELSAEMRSELSLLFKDEILSLQDLIQEDLSIWH